MRTTALNQVPVIGKVGSFLFRSLGTKVPPISRLIVQLQIWPLQRIAESLPSPNSLVDCTIQGSTILEWLSPTSHLTSLRFCCQNNHECGGFRSHC